MSSRPPRAGLALGTVVAAFALAGCAAAEAGPQESAPAPATALTITMSDVDGRGGETSTYGLTCDPVGGTLPTAAAACGRLEQLTDPFAPVPDGVACLEVIAGPGIITVRGTLRGDPVRAQFSQVDSCQDGWFQDVLSLLGVS